MAIQFTLPSGGASLSENPCAVPDTVRRIPVQAVRPCGPRLQAPSAGARPFSWPHTSPADSMRRGLEAHLGALRIRRTFEADQLRSILVVGPNWLGDAVLALPTLANLRRSFPGARITLLVRSWVRDLFRASPFVDELIEAPRDPFWHFVTQSLHGFSSTPQAVWAFIFLSHGIVKTLLAIGLLKNIRWIYPASAIVFALFVIYQCYQYIYAPSFLLIAITVFDIVLIGLILHEYRRHSIRSV